MAAYVAGNGMSRKVIPLDKVKSKGVLYGCNAIYKEITPDVLVATDPGPAHAIQMMGYAREHVFYTRKPYSNYGAKKLKELYAGWSSGPNAIQLAILDGHTEIYLFGFDFGSRSGSYNNIFAGHEFYNQIGSVPTYGGNWVHQVKSVLTHNKNIQFYIVVGHETAEIAQFCMFKNLKILTTDEFLKHINNV